MCNFASRAWRLHLQCTSCMCKSSCAHNHMRTMVTCNVHKLAGQHAAPRSEVLLRATALCFSTLRGSQCSDATKGLTPLQAHQ